MFGVL